MNCPVCDERLREVEKNGINIDVCPSCKGVWLDRGELEKLIEISASYTDRSKPDIGSAKNYDKHDDHEHGNREHDSDRGRRDSSEHGYGERKKKGGWLGDILGGIGGD